MLLEKAQISKLLPMEAQSVSSLPFGECWRYEPKWDGFRCLAHKQGKEILLRSKSGKPLERYFPDVVSRLEKAKAGNFIVDGELVIPQGEGFSFSGLQMRLHPAASRVERLARETPASFILFDILRTPEGEDMKGEQFSKRRKALEKFHREFFHDDMHIQLSPQTKSLKTAKEWLRTSRGRMDGIVAKKTTDIYMPEARLMQKYKPLRTADCAVGGFRYGANSTLVGSLLLGLYDDDGLLHHVGFTSSIYTIDKPVLTKKLEKMKGAPGFTGRAPGAPSRWSTERSAAWVPLKPGLVVEVSYDHVTHDRFRHGTKLIRFRPDKEPWQCKMEQIRD